MPVSDKDFIRGRGAVSNPANRFEKFHFEPDPNVEPDDAPAPKTQFFKENAGSILTHNDSPNVPFDAGLNPYRGCEHGCIYCFARAMHEYLGFSAGLDFETKILVKQNSPELLRKELGARKWKPQLISLGSATDCYQPAERQLRLTRQCLEVLAECRNPVGIVTKNFLVTRDVDLLKELARWQAVQVLISITTLDSDLTRVMEPRTSSPRQRLAAIKILAEAGVPVGVLVAPVIPGLTDHEMVNIITEAAAAGARFAAYDVVRLPYSVKDLFQQWLQVHFPNRMQKVMDRIRLTKSGELTDAKIGLRTKGQGVFAQQMDRMFTVACRKAGMTEHWPNLSTAAFRRPLGNQLPLL